MPLVASIALAVPPQPRISTAARSPSATTLTYAICRPSLDHASAPVDVPEGSDGKPSAFAPVAGLTATPARRRSAPSAVHAMGLLSNGIFVSFFVARSRTQHSMIFTRLPSRSVRSRSKFARANAIVFPSGDTVALRPSAMRAQPGGKGVSAGFGSGGGGGTLGPFPPPAPAAPGASATAAATHTENAADAAPARRRRRSARRLDDMGPAPKRSGAQKRSRPARGAVPQRRREARASARSGSVRGGGAARAAGAHTPRSRQASS